MFELWCLIISHSSQIDTTAIQALVDTRNEVERWADHPVEWHFATVLSPWIRRALIAGGFGTGSSSSRAPTEVVQVVHLGDVRGPSPMLPEKASDVESGGIIEEDLRHRGSSSSAYGATDHPGGPITLQNTPYFHFDVVSAVRAAESGLEHSRDRAPSVASIEMGKRLITVDEGL